MTEDRANELDDDETFTYNLEQYGLDAFRFARFLGLDSDEAADAVQEAALAAWRYRGTRRGEWRPWFFAILRRTAQRTKRRWILIPWAWQPEPGESRLDTAGSSELTQALGRLTRRQRAAVWLRYGQDLTYSEVGKVMGLREAAAKQLVARARLALKQALGGALADG